MQKRLNLSGLTFMKIKSDQHLKLFSYFGDPTIKPDNRWNFFFFWKWTESLQKNQQQKIYQKDYYIGALYSLYICNSMGTYILDMSTLNSENGGVFAHAHNSFMFVTWLCKPLIFQTQPHVKLSSN